MNETLRVFVLWFPDWPLRAVLGAAPPHPLLALTHGGSIAACTASARTQGVRIGQRQRTAQGHAPALRLLAYDQERDERAFAPVLKLIEQHAPGAHFLRPGLAALRARGFSRYHGGETEAADAMTELLSHAGYPEVRIGVADGPFTAELAARSGSSAVAIVEPGGAQQFLAPLPVQVLREEKYTDLLLRLGVRTLGEFAALPAADVRARFGERGARLHSLAGGSDSRPLVVRRPDPELSREIEFDSPLAGSDQVAFAARQTADAVIEALGDASGVCTEVRVDLTDDNGVVHSRTWLHPTYFTPSDLVDRVRWQLEALALKAQGLPVDEARAFGGILSVRISPLAVDDAAHHQPGLFGSGTDERLHHAVSRVQTMLGHQGVVLPARSGGRWLADRQVLTPWGERHLPERDPQQPWPGSLPHPLPTEVFRPPLAITVSGADGELLGIDERGALSAAPAFLDNHAIASWAGPWPVHEHGWSNNRARVAHRFQVVDDRNRAWLIFRSGERWWAEGRYL